MNLNKTVFAITILALIAMAARFSVDSDTWWHLRAGQWMIENRQIIRVDQFSYTRMGVDWHYPGWIVEVLMDVIFRLFGPGGLNLWTAIMVSAAFGVLWLALSGGPLLRAFSIIFAATASAVYWAARPYLITFLLTAVFIWILEYRRQGKQNRQWWLPFLMVLWVNSHGGFIVGFLLWGAFVVQELWDQGVMWSEKSKDPEVRPVRGISGGIKPLVSLLLVGMAMLLAVMVNPSGPEMLLYPFKTVGINVLQQYIQEWQSPNFHQVHVLSFALLLLLTFSLAGFSPKRLLVVEFLLLAGFGLLSLLAARNIALFALSAPLALTRHGAAIWQEFRERYPYLWSRWMPNHSPPRPVLNLGLVILFTFAAGIKVWSVSSPASNDNALKKSMPVEAVSHIRNSQPEGRLFNDYDWGAFLLWALPEYPVFVDGRTDLYDDEIVGEWLQVVQASPGWEDVLDEWGINLILISPARPISLILEDSGWRLTYQDEIAWVFSR